jgi:hypothetical protein
MLEYEPEPDYVPVTIFDLVNAGGIAGCICYSRAAEIVGMVPFTMEYKNEEKDTDELVLQLLQNSIEQNRPFLQQILYSECASKFVSKEYFDITWITHKTLQLLANTVKQIKTPQFIVKSVYDAVVLHNLRTLTWLQRYHKILESKPFNTRTLQINQSAALLEHVMTQPTAWTKEALLKARALRSFWLDAEWPQMVAQTLEDPYLRHTMARTGQGLITFVQAFTPPRKPLQPNLEEDDE